MTLSPTAHVILGLLSSRDRTGYEIKAAVDRSTRFFWAASYGQIYPELKRLADAGMVEGRPDPRGARRRTVYSLTAAGRRELQRWLAEPAETFELRDEGLLKLFFGDDLEPPAAVAAVAAKREHHAQIAGRLHAIEREGGPGGFPGLVLRFGIEMNEWISAWWDREGERLGREAAEERAA
jgi:DNA-binding PadR family transcriptional regulator